MEHYCNVLLQVILHLVDVQLFFIIRMAFLLDNSCLVLKQIVNLVIEIAFLLRNYLSLKIAVNCY